MSGKKNKKNFRTTSVTRSCLLLSVPFVSFKLNIRQSRPVTIDFLRTLMVARLLKRN